MSDLTLAALRAAFEKSKPAACDTALLSFKGADGYDVYNCSAPFQWRGKTHLFGRVERREEAAESRSCLFVESSKDTFTLLEDSMHWQLEDPFVAAVDGAFLFGGTQVVKDMGKVVNDYCDLYRGASPERPVYFTTGADGTRFVRVVQMADRHIGVFAQTSGGVGIGFTKVAKLTDVNRASTAKVKPIAGLEGLAAVGVVNHPYLLSSGRIGCIAHHSDASSNEKGSGCSCATSFVYDPATNAASNFRVLATKECFIDCPSKACQPEGSVFPSGILVREGGKCDLYVGLGSTSEGRLMVDYPFEGHGRIVSNLSF